MIVMQKRFGFVLNWKASWFSYIPVMASVLILKNVFVTYLIVPFLLLSWENCFKVSRYHIIAGASYYLFWIYKLTNRFFCLVLELCVLFWTHIGLAMVNSLLLVPETPKKQNFHEINLSAIIIIKDCIYDHSEISVTIVTLMCNELII